MALTAALLDAKLARRIARQPATFTWDGQEWACAVGDLTRSKETGLAGLEPEFDLIVRTRASLFVPKGKRPGRGQTLRQAGQDFSIISDVLSADGVQVTLYCQAKTR